MTINRNVLSQDLAGLLKFYGNRFITPGMVKRFLTNYSDAQLEGFALSLQIIFEKNNI